MRTPRKATGVRIPEIVAIRKEGARPCDGGDVFIRGEGNGGLWEGEAKMGSGTNGSARACDPMRKGGGKAREDVFVSQERRMQGIIEYVYVSRLAAPRERATGGEKHRWFRRLRRCGTGHSLEGGHKGKP